MGWKGHVVDILDKLQLLIRKFEVSLSLNHKSAIDYHPNMEENLSLEICSCDGRVGVRLGVSLL